MRSIVRLLTCVVVAAVCPEASASTSSATVLKFTNDSVGAQGSAASSPVVGILTQSWDANHTYMAASYAKLVEMAGGQVRGQLQRSFTVFISLQYLCRPAWAGACALDDCLVFTTK